MRVLNPGACRPLQRQHLACIIEGVQRFASSAVAFTRGCHLLRAGIWLDGTGKCPAFEQCKSQSAVPLHHELRESNPFIGGFDSATAFGAYMLRCQRHMFSLPSDGHYLNCAYMAPLAQCVEEAGKEGLRRKRNPAAITPAMFFDESSTVRTLFGRLINAPAERVAIIPSASYGIATAACNIPVAPGQNIVILYEQFPSNVYSWRRLADNSNAELRTVGPGAPHTSWDTMILEAIDAQTAVIAMSAVHWTDGTCFDLEAIGNRARQFGAAFVLDATQSAGALPIDATALGIDALICAAYKWLLGPYSIGAAYFGPRFDTGRPLEENWITRAGSEQFAGLIQYQDSYQPGAIRYDVGERSNFILLPMLIAGLRLVLEWKPSRIQAYIRSLTDSVAREVRALGYNIGGPADRGTHLFGIRCPSSVSLDRVTYEVTRRNISVSRRGDAIRVSPHVYNDATDMNALLAALRSAIRV